MKHNASIKIPKFMLQIYAFVYQMLMDFLTTSRFAKFEMLTMLDLFKTVHRVIIVKIHLHHSHVTGKIYGYATNFSFCVLRTTFLVLICFFYPKKFDFQCGKHRI